MANQLSNLLAEWYPNRDNCDWVLGTVYKTEGPCYRKAGAMMLFNSVGQQFGMLSGGCLESDIQRHARKVMQTGTPVTLCYDGSDEDDLSFQLGIGCGGTVYIMLIPVHTDNGYQQLELLREALIRREPGQYLQPIPINPCSRSAQFVAGTVSGHQQAQAWIEQKKGVDYLITPVSPEPHLLVLGGGIDARPVVAMAKQLGWKVSVWDPRPANARKEFFMDADLLLRNPANTLPEFVRQQRVDAAVMMSHSIALDAAALAQLNTVSLKFMALLGPVHRKQQVMERAGLAESDLRQPLSGPAGLDIGGELPESIALSILSECHSVLHKPQVIPASGVIRRELAA